MGAVTLETCAAETVVEWRAWLEQHHASSPGVWLVFNKQHTGRASISYLDALDEALCFGWVDSLIKRLDEARYVRKFTPRRDGSRWSAINRRRYRELKNAGRVHPAGLRRAPTGRGYDPLPTIPSRVPPFIHAALRKHPAAARYFRSLPPSHRRRYVGWIVLAKQDATRKRRLAEAIRLLTAGKPLGLK